MHKAIKRTLAAVALITGTIAAVFAVTATGAKEPATPAPSRLAALPPEPVPLIVSAPLPDDSVDVDPFAPRGWQAEAAPPEPEPVAEIAPPPAAAPPPQPTLPFKFMGRLSDAGQAVVYISNGDDLWTIKGGETLTSDYKVITLSAHQIVFEHLPSGTQHTLAIPEPEK